MRLSLTDNNFNQTFHFCINKIITFAAQKFIELKKIKDFTEGHILRQIITLALPIMGSSFIQMAYNMTDMLWLGHIGSGAAAAVGAAGFFVWLGNSLGFTTKFGAEIGISQSLGAKSTNRAKLFASHSVIMGVSIALLFTVFIRLFADNLVGIFNFQEADVVKMSTEYLMIVSLGMVFTFMNPTLSGIYNGTGNSSIPFYFNTVGLILNIALDPILMFGYLGAPALGTNGAAIATVFSQAVVTGLFILHLSSKRSPFPNFFNRGKISPQIAKSIFKFGSPIALQSGMFSVFAMIMARIVSDWGAIAVAIQSVGAQIEAISWMTASAFATALGSFVGQNYGAKKFDRIRKSYFHTLSITLLFGIGASILFIFGGEMVFSWFIPEPEAIKMGGVYLRILGYSQTFMILEIVTTGAFNGTGKTVPPSITGTLLTAARIPLALLLAYTFAMELDGVWWSITLSSIAKGTILFIWFRIAFNRLLRNQNIEIETKSILIRLLPTRIRQQVFSMLQRNKKN